MKPELLAGLIAGVVAIAEVANVVMFLKIRVAQLESERRVLDKVHEEYVPRELCLLSDCPQRAHGAARG